MVIIYLFFYFLIYSDVVVVQILFLFKISEYRWGFVGKQYRYPIYV